MKFGMKTTMKKALFAVASFGLVLGLGAPVASADDTLEYHGYFRSGVVTSDKGGKIYNFGQSKVGRLGNEYDGNYEFVFKKHVQKAEKDGDPYWYIQSRLALWTTQTEDRTFGQKENAGVAEAFVEGGNVIGENIIIWAGRRMLKGPVGGQFDVHLIDLFHFKEGSGNGIGLTFKADMAQFDIHFRKHGGTTHEWGGTIDNAVPQTSVWDFMASDIKLGGDLVLALTVGFASNSGGTNADGDSKEAAYRLDTETGEIVQDPAEAATPGTEYEAVTGSKIGAKLNMKLGPVGNELTIIQGSGLYSFLNNEFDCCGDVDFVNPTPKVEGDGPDLAAASKLRVIDSLGYRTGNFEVAAAYKYESRDNGAKENSEVVEHSFVVRPVYHVTPAFSLNVEVGHNIEDEDKKDQDPKTLTKFTVAPEVHIAWNTMWARPAIRAYYSNFSWNDERNGTGGPAYDGENSASAWGFQVEVWW